MNTITSTDVALYIALMSAISLPHYLNEKIKARKGHKQ